jgi:sugar lactone lactonase YvrE
VNTTEHPAKTPIPLALVASLLLAMVVVLALIAAPVSARVIHAYRFQVTEAAGAGFCPGSIATDAADDLYLGDNCRGLLDKLDSSGATVSSWGTNGQIAEVQGTHLSSPEGLATDSSENLWFADRGLGAVYKLSPTGSFQARAEGPEPGGAFPFGGAFLGSLAWSEAANRLFVADSASEVLWGIEPTGSYSGISFSAPGCCSTQVAADNSGGESGGDLYVSASGSVRRIHASGIEAGEPHAFSFSASYIGSALLTGTSAAPFGEIVGLAVDSAGDLYVAQRKEVDEFAASGEYLGRIAGTPTGPGGEFEPFSQVNNVAVGSISGNLYIGTAGGVDVFAAAGLTLPDVSTLPAEVHSTTEATLQGEVNPDELPLTECFFEYGPTTAYGHSAACEPGAAALGEGNTPVAVKAQLANLTPGAVYHYRLVAANANGTNSESEDREFVTGATIDATSASEVTATSAKLEAEINPHGLATTYHFEYDTAPYTAGDAPHGISLPVPDGAVGAGEGDVTRTAQVQGLQAGTAYHYRVLATNALGTVVGPDRVFTTQPAAFASILPDGRGWELVSPPDKHGVPLGAISEEGGVIQAAAEGSGIAYYAKGPIVSEPAGSRSFVDSQDLSTRVSGGSWSTQDITTPHQAPTGVIPGDASEYKLFSSDLSLGAVEPIGATPLSPRASEPTPYLRAPDGSYTPLVYPGNVPEGTHFGGVELGFEEFGGGVHFIAATPDLSHVLLGSPTTLVEGFHFQTGEGIYDWNAGALTPVSFVPPGAAPLCGGAAPACEPSGGGVGHGFRVRNAISTDGSRVILDGGLRLYLRDLSRGETIQLDADEPGCGAGCKSGDGVFQDASTNGRRVFFTDEQRLTADSTAASGKPDLYMCEVEVEAEHLACALRDLSVNAVNSAEPATVKGAVIGASADGSSVYFVADGALSTGEGAVSGDCVLAGGIGSGECNLYRYDLATEAVSLVAVLSGADFHDWAAASEGSDLGQLTARISPNGEWLAFMSERPLTGYDNRDARSGERDQEVFLYDAKGEGGAGKLLCASCNPTGARPAGRQGPPNIPPALVDVPRLWEQRWYAANLPGWTRVDLSHALYQSRYLSDSGRLFFNANDALVPQDSNGTEDVYEYEPSKGSGQPASNDCTESSPIYSPTSQGCVSLITSGTSPEESAFMDASESGSDVFFLTASRLTASDEDRALDLYDARVGGGEPEPVKPPACEGDACQNLVQAPSDPSPGSLTFSGPGNPVPFLAPRTKKTTKKAARCRKPKKRSRGKCVKPKKKAKRAKKAGRASNDRRATR